MTQIGRPVHIRGTSYDGEPHWLHAAYLILQRGALLVTQTFAGTEVRTRTGATWASPYDTRGHYWTDRWYNVIRLERPAGKGLFGFYCNVATPAEFDGENLHYCDLQLDVRIYVEPEGWRREILDEDEFMEAQARLRYPPELVLDCRAAVDELLRLVQAREFPFNV
jgi:protein associated with RNAse G/E